MILGVIISQVCTQEGTQKGTGKQITASGERAWGAGSTKQMRSQERAWELQASASNGVQVGVYKRRLEGDFLGAFECY